MRILKQLFDNNRRWAERLRERDPEMFARLSEQQNPDYVWIGCSDSRVPANEIVGLMPGELFVHRNVANVVVQTDLNCLSVLQFAVDVLKVGHVIVCGHYRCGGVEATLDPRPRGLIDNWLQGVADVRDRHAAILERAASSAERSRLLCELNVIEQVANVCRTTVVQSAWRRGAELSIHGWIYDISDALLRDLDVTAVDPQDAIASRERAVARVSASLG